MTGLPAFYTNSLIHSNSFFFSFFFSKKAVNLKNKLYFLFTFSFHKNTLNQSSDSSWQPGMEWNRDSKRNRLHHPAFRAIWLSRAVCLPTDRDVIVVVFLSVFVSFFSCQKCLFFSSTAMLASTEAADAPAWGCVALGTPRIGLGWKGGTKGR